MEKSQYAQEVEVIESDRDVCIIFIGIQPVVKDGSKKVLTATKEVVRINLPLTTAKELARKLNKSI